MITYDFLSLLRLLKSSLFLLEIRPNVVPKNKKALKSIKIPRLVEVSSGFEPL